MKRRKAAAEREKLMNDKLDKLKINTILNRKEPCFEPESCIVEKVVEIPHSTFGRLISKPLCDNYHIRQYRDLMGYYDDAYHCILAVDKEFGDGLLIESEGSNYARYAQYIPHAQDIVKAFNQTMAVSELKSHIENCVNDWLEQSKDDKEFCISTGDFLNNPFIENILTKYAAEVMAARPEIAASSCGNGFIEAVKNDLVETRLYCPLTILAEPEDDCSDLVEMPSQRFVAYEDIINARIAKSLDIEEKERGLITWCGDESLGRKVFSAIPSVEAINGSLYGEVTLKSYGGLDKAELTAVSDYITGQLSDGWGEGFEQKEIKLGCDCVYISFWNSEDYYLRPESEAFPEQNIQQMSQ